MSSCRLAVRVAGIALVANGDARFDVRPDVEQGFEVTRIGSLAACQVESDDVARGVRLGMDFRREPAARAPKRLPLLPPFAPAADTCARRMVESNIWIRCAERELTFSRRGVAGVFSHASRRHTPYKFASSTMIGL